MLSHKRLPVRRCAIKTCDHFFGTEKDGVRFYRIIDHPNWIETLKQQQVDIHGYICNEHFSDSDFTDHARKKFIKGALPSIFKQKKNEKKVRVVKVISHQQFDSQSKQIENLQETINELRKQAEAREYKHDLQLNRLKDRYEELESKLKERENIIKSLRLAVKNEKCRSSQLENIIEVFVNRKCLTTDDAINLHVRNANI